MLIAESLSDALIRTLVRWWSRFCLKMYFFLD